MTQKACKKLLEHGNKLNKPLLMKTIRNLFIDHYRRMQLVQFDAFDESTHDTALDHTLDALASRMDIAAALGVLRPEEREVIYLHMVEGYTCQEVADFTARPPGTVLSLVHRAKKKMVATLTTGEECQGEHRGLS